MMEAASWCNFREGLPLHNFFYGIFAIAVEAEQVNAFWQISKAHGDQLSPCTESLRLLFEQSAVCAEQLQVYLTVMEQMEADVDIIKRWIREYLHTITGKEIIRSGRDQAGLDDSALVGSHGAVLVTLSRSDTCF